MIKTYLQEHPDVKQFWVMASEVDYCLCRVDDDDHMRMFGRRKIKEVEPPPEPDEVITFHI